MKAKSSEAAPENMNAEQCAAYIGVAESTLWEMKLQYRLPFVKLGKGKGRIIFRKWAIDKWLDEQMVNSPQEEQKLNDGRRKIGVYQ